MSAHDPGLDLHEWETEYQALDEQLRDDPASALPDLADLVERVLAGSGYALNDTVSREGDDPEIVAEFASAREVATRAERGDDVSPGDVAQAIDGLRALYEAVVADRRAP